jgi:amino acid transporter
LAAGSQWREDIYAAEWRSAELCSCPPRRCLVEKLTFPSSKFNYYLKKPLFLATCLFGITFITLENTAPNSVAFAQNILDAAHVDATPGKIIAISLSANAFCCLLHAISRRWGIILNNVFGVVKLLILVFIVIIGLVWTNRDVARSNFDVTTSFSLENSPRLPFRYAEALLNALYPYGLFHQINYVGFASLLHG